MFSIFAPFHFLLSFLASVLRLGAGVGVPPVDLKEPIILYEFEGCPYCRIAREAVSEAGVPVLVRPCPKGGKRFRPSVKEQGGKAQFPYMIDPNTDTALYESAAIGAYLRRTYGPRARPLAHWLGPINHLLSQLAVLARLMAGNLVRPAAAPAAPLAFYGAERNPGARLVKELLCEMEIEYVWRARAGQGERTPRLVDPNTGEARTGAVSIRKYLKSAYRS